MDIRLFWLIIILTLILTSLAVFASYTSMTTRWLVLKRWMLRGLAMACLGIVLFIPLLHIALLGFFTKGKFHEKGRFSHGEVVSIKINPLTDLITVHVDMPIRTSRSLANLTDSITKSRTESFLVNNSSLIYSFRINYDVFAMLLPYRIEILPSYLTYSLPSGKQIKVWSVSTMRPSNLNESIHILEYESDLQSDDPSVYKKEVEEIWEALRITVDREQNRLAEIRVRGSSPIELRDNARKVYNFRYVKGEDGTWQVIFLKFADT